MTAGAELRDDSRLETDGHVAGPVLLNRPDRLNSFTAQMWAEMRTLGRALVADPGDIRVLVVQWRGPRLLERHRHVGVRRWSGRRASSATTTPAATRRPDGERDPQRAGRVHAGSPRRRSSRSPRSAASRSVPVCSSRSRATSGSSRAAPSSGLLELQYGILPDLGGTQRLPAHRRHRQGHRADQRPRRRSTPTRRCASAWSSGSSATRS